MWLRAFPIIPLVLCTRLKAADEYIAGLIYYLTHFGDHHHENYICKVRQALLNISTTFAYNRTNPSPLYLQPNLLLNSIYYSSSAN